MVNIVERAEILALTCVSYDNGTAVEACIIKCVHRLSVLKHYIVRNIYNIIYGTNAGCAETHTHPERRGRDVNILYNASGVTRAKLAVLHLDREIIRYAVALVRCAEDRLVICSRSAVGRCGLASHAYHREAIGTVRRDLELDNTVTQPEHVADVVAGLVFAERRIIIENENAVLDSIRHIVLGKSELGNGAEHSVRLGAAELAALDVAADHLCGGACNGHERACINIGRSGNYLAGSLLADVDRADNESVGIGMTLDREYLTDADIFELAAERLPVLDL